MEFLSGVIFGVIIAAAAAWYFYLRPRESATKEIERELNSAVLMATNLLGAVKSCHYNLYGPIGAPEQVLHDSFNHLWRLADLEERGFKR